MIKGSPHNPPPLTLDIKNWEKAIVMDDLTSVAAVYILRHLSLFHGNSIVLHNFPHGREID